MVKTLFASFVLATAVATSALASPVLPTATAPNGSSSPTQTDAAFGTDMGVVHELLADHNKIKRTVTDLPNGIRTQTESDDPTVAKEIKDHVASMDRRLKDGRVFNIASRTLPKLFANAASIHTDVRQTATGVIVTQTSSDPATVAALQAHAGEVTDLAREGMVALHRSMMANGGPMGSGMMAQMRGMMMQGGMMGDRENMMDGGAMMERMHGPDRPAPPTRQ